MTLDSPRQLTPPTIVLALRLTFFHGHAHAGSAVVVSLALTRTARLSLAMYRKVFPRYSRVSNYGQMTVTAADGLRISWIPKGLHIELSKVKVGSRSPGPLVTYQGIVAGYHI